MKLKSAIVFLLLVVILFSTSFTPQKQSGPRIGVIVPIKYDSLAYNAGFRLLGESVAKMLSPAVPDAEFARNLSQIKKARCKVYLCNLFFSGNIKIAGPDVNEKQVLDYADTVFFRAQKAGIAIIVLGSGGSRRIPENYDLQKAQNDFIVLCRKLAVVAAKYKVMVALESLEQTESNFLTSLSSAASIVRAVNHPNFKLNADIFHMMREGESPQSIVDAGELLVHCEIAEKQSRSYPGVKGDDFKPYLRALKKANYKGSIFIEANTNNFAADLPLSFTYLTRQVDEVYAEK